MDPEVPELVPEAEGPAAAAAGSHINPKPTSVEEEGRAAKRQRTETSTQASADYSYDPKDLTDFTLKTADGKVIAVHRCFVLRYSKLINTLLETCPTGEVTVTETADEIRSYFLNPIYDRSVSIGPRTVLHVLDLADKYEAPLLVAACQDVLLSDAFTLSHSKGELAAGNAECDALEALALAGKHGFAALAQKATQFLHDRSVVDCEKVANYLKTNGPALKALGHDEVLVVLQEFATGTGAVQKSVKVKLHEAERAKGAAKDEVKAANAEVARHKKIYTKLLSKYNKLVAKARAAGMEVP